MTKQKRNNINTNKTTATLQVTTFKNIASNNRPIKPIVICSNSTMEIPDLMFLISSKFSLKEFVNFEIFSVVPIVDFQQVNTGGIPICSKKNHDFQRSAL